MNGSKGASEAVSPALVALTGQSGQGGALPPAGIPRNTLQRWIRYGFLRLDTPGHGHRRAYPPEELRAARALDSLRQLAGAPLTTDSAGGLNAQRRALQHAVAECARANPPGTVHDLPSPAPWLRVVLIVPE